MRLAEKAVRRPENRLVQAETMDDNLLLPALESVRVVGDFDLTVCATGAKAGVRIQRFAWWWDDLAIAHFLSPVGQGGGSNGGRDA